MRYKLTLVVIIEIIQPRTTACRLALLAKPCTNRTITILKIRVSGGGCFRLAQVSHAESKGRTESEGGYVRGREEETN
jgi:hypothetical protein